MSFGSFGEEHFRLAVELSPSAMIVTADDGLIHFANAETERIFGYTNQQLVGQSVDMLVPTRFRYEHASLRKSFFSAPSKRPMGVGRDLRARRFDGSEFPVEIGPTAGRRAWLARPFRRYQSISVSNLGVAASE